MNNLVIRIITTGVGVPAVVCILILLPQMNHLAFVAVAFVASAIGSMEMGRILFKRNSWTWLIPSLLVPIQYLELYFGFPYRITDIIFGMLALFLFVLEIWKGEKDGFSHSLDNCAKRLLLLFYPGYLITFLIRMLALNIGKFTGGWFLLLMILLVFSNDIFAYVFGRMFGRNNGGIVPVSPHKSIAGFIGGAVCCTLLSILLCRFIFESISIIPSILLGLCVSITANLGDLVESLFKRSAGVKDSGNVIPGRGGMLDSIDSIISTVPVFLILLEIFA